MEKVKEALSALISVVIVWLSVTMLWSIFQSGGRPLSPDGLTAYNRQKDVVMLALGLLGTVTGYYLGRVPAELRAQKAEQTASQAQSQVSSAITQAATITAKAGSLAAGVKRVRDDLSSQEQRTRASLSSGATMPAHIADIERARRDLDGLLEVWR